MKPKSALRSVRLIALLLAMGIGATALDVLVFFPRRPAAGDGAIHRVEIPEGVGRNRLADILTRAGLCDSPGRLALWLRFSGDLKRVKVGTFDVPDNLTPVEIMAALAGRTSDKGVKVVIPEGFTLGKIARALADADILDESAFIAAATNAAAVNAAGFEGASFEGYLFPDTYYFKPGETPEGILRIMTETFRKRLKVAGIPVDKQLQHTVILASIVQAEARVAREMPVIAGVYLNRLNSPNHPSRLLQADPTVSYGCEPYVVPKAVSCLTFKGTLGRKQLDDETNPYNTYKHPGLPPGPIAAPGAAALEAAYRPKTVPYLYFVAAASADGTHVFSATYPEHQRAVDALRASGN